MGAAEALVAAVVAPPPPRVPGSSRGLSVYPHVVDSTASCLGALRARPVLGRALATLGATTIEQRLRVRRGGATRGRAGDVRVEGLDMADDHVSVGWPEGTDPLSSVGGGARFRTREVVASEVAAMRAVGVPVDDVVVTGGWAHFQSVVRAGPSGADPPRRDGGTRDKGAALFARWAAARHPAGSDPRPRTRRRSGALVGPTLESGCP